MLLSGCVSVQPELKLPKLEAPPPATLEAIIQSCEITKNKASAECQWIVKLEKDYQKREM